ncbi:hypothetical protein [Pseudomonas solani]|uniref:hypothetical protein n=1 Tax=Pseudomonas solani TaxID=2731552 RepID=UPI003D6A97E9
MTNSLIQVYLKDVNLKSDERKRLYKEILEKDFFGERDKYFQRAFKRLMFEGELETYELLLSETDELGIRRPNNLGHMAGAYICLASPLPSVDFYQSVLRRYPYVTCLDIAEAAVRYIDGDSSVSSDLILRARCLIEAVDGVAAELGKDFVVDGSCYARIFGGFLSNVSYCGSSENCLFPYFLPKIDASISSFTGQAKKLMDDYSEDLLKQLFSGEANHPTAYLDEEFKIFFSRYVAREYTSQFLSYLDGVYNAISLDKRIQWDGAKILCSAD